MNSCEVFIRDIVFQNVVLLNLTDFCNGAENLGEIWGASGVRHRDVRDFQCNDIMWVDLQTLYGMLFTTFAVRQSWRTFSIFPILTHKRVSCSTHILYYICSFSIFANAMLFAYFAPWRKHIFVLVVYFYWIISAGYFLGATQPAFWKRLVIFLRDINAILCQNVCTMTIVYQSYFCFSALDCKQSLENWATIYLSSFVFEHAA